MSAATAMRLSCARRDEDDRRRVGHVADRASVCKTVEAGHVVVERDDVDVAFACSARDAACRVASGHDTNALARQPALDQTAQAGVVVDVEDGGRHALCSCGGRDLDDGEEQAELADGVGEAFVVHRLGDVDVAAEIVAALDLALSSVVVSTTTGERLRCSLALICAQDVDAGHVRQVEVEQDQQRRCPC